MKIFYIIKKVILVLAFVLASFAFILGGITLASSDTAFSVAMISFILFGFIGFMLFDSKNDIARRIGLGLTTAFMLIQLYLAIMSIGTSTSAIFALVSVILYAVYFLIAFIGFIALGSQKTDDPETDPRVKKILGWKNLQKEGIISAEEFEAKRLEILGIKAKDQIKK